MCYKIGFILYHFKYSYEITLGCDNRQVHVAMSTVQAFILVMIFKSDKAKEDEELGRSETYRMNNQQ
ncbi:CLUMA_CG013038, isoform A [Clunio marinus]|uniref:CLUMA_CG013038, isoform A n=1 Tax=Clunio marinus TaxID=568069 RepID=A0A1J1IJH0_9DIPT|nr:CLUMA_CG013038, isoform A [Clunio marinus]